jgi:hypothetical protein
MVEVLTEEMSGQTEMVGDVVKQERLRPLEEVHWGSFLKKADIV